MHHTPQHSINMEEDDYESLPEYASTSDHMIAGAAAGILEHTIIYPVDVIKVILDTSMIKYKCMSINPD